MTSSHAPSQDHSWFKSILERFRVEQGSAVSSEKSTHVCQQQFAKNPGSKSILDKILSSHYRERSKWNMTHMSFMLTQEDEGNVKVVSMHTLNEISFIFKY